MLSSRLPLLKSALGVAAAVLIGAAALGGCSSGRSSSPPVQLPKSSVPVSIYSVDPNRPLLGYAYGAFVPPSKNVDWLYQLVVLAHSSITISADRLSDPQLVKLLVWQAQGGVSVRVLLSNSSTNRFAYSQLQAGGVQVEYANSGLLQSTITLDKQESIISSMDYVSSLYSHSRSFGVIDHDPRDVHAIVSTFETDWASSTQWAVGRRGPHLVWSPGGLTPTVGLISSAQVSVVVETEQLDSPQIVAALAGVAQRGVPSSVVVGPGGVSASNLGVLTKAGVHVFVLPAAVHRVGGNAIVIDGSTASFGSQRLSVAGLDASRALNVVFDSSSVGVVPVISAAVSNDLSSAQPYTAPGT
jgi:hypothetical protein